MCHPGGSLNQPGASRLVANRQDKRTPGRRLGSGFVACYQSFGVLPRRGSLLGLLGTHQQDLCVSVETVQAGHASLT